MKNLFFLLVAFVAVVFISCDKDEENINPTQKIKMFMSVEAAKSILKSANTVTGGEPVEISNGDTVDVYQLIDLNTVLIAEDEYGNKIAGTWMFDLVESDDLYRRSVPSFYNEKSIISVKMHILGLYQVVFRPKMGEAVGFLIRNTGVPGEVGDEWANDYSFRLESASFFKMDYPLQKGFTFFIKSTDNQFDDMIGLGYDPKLDDSYFTVIYGSGDQATAPLKRCKYAPGYFYTSIIKNEIAPGSDGTYRLVFGLGEFGNNWFYFRSMDKSDYYSYGTINFKIF